MCTTLLITAKDKAVVSGRTMEFGFDVESEVMVIPAGAKMTGTIPNLAKTAKPTQDGISYTTKYGMIGANALGFSVIVDGINEKGLYSALSTSRATPTMRR
jgi:choloylglycine hydrolase